MIKLHDRNDFESPKSSTFSMYQMICKYKLRDFLMSCVRANHFRELNDMKLVIKRVVWQHEKACWKTTQILYPELRLFYSVVVDITVNIWWRIAAKIPRCTKWISNVVCVIMGAEPRARQCNFGRTICKLCDMNRKDVTLHVLSVCPSLEDVRRNGWRDIKMSMPDAMARHVETLPVENRLEFILAGLDETTSMNGNWYTVILPNLSQIYIESKRLYSESHMNWTLLTLQDNVAFDGLGINFIYLIESYIPAWYCMHISLWTLVKYACIVIHAHQKWWKYIYIYIYIAWWNHDTIPSASL